MGGERGGVGNSAGRAMLVALALVLQIAYLARLLARAGARWHWAATAVELLALGAAVAVCGQCRSAASKLRWLALILILPLPGLCLYLTLGRPWVDASVRRRFAGARDGSLTQDAEALRSLEAARPEAAGQSRYLWNAGGWPVYRDTRAEFHPQGALAFAALKRELRAARRFIFMEYHAVELSRCFREIEEILAERAAAGVEVRLLYDDVGSMAFVGPGLARRLEARGVRCRVFNPMVPLARPFLNNRDHRKLTVIDGVTGLTGGYNLCDEYFAEKHPFGHWKDTGLLLRGPAVRSLTAMFLQMWRAAGTEAEADEPSKYLAPEAGEQAVEQDRKPLNAHSSPDIERERLERAERGDKRGRMKRVKRESHLAPAESASSLDLDWVLPYTSAQQESERGSEKRTVCESKRGREGQAEREGHFVLAESASLDIDRMQSYAGFPQQCGRGSAERAERAGWLAPAERTSPPDCGWVQPYASSPLDGERVGENAYLNLIKAARRFVWIATPYLIPDDDTCRELALAVKRGVDVRVIVPGIPDKRPVYLLTRANCARLAREGARVFAYAPGFLHAKQLLADGRSAAVGTVNLDYRSLYQHFENGVLLHNSPAVADIQRDFEATFPLCRELTEQATARHCSAPEVAIQGLLRLFAPLM